MSVNLDKLIELIDSASKNVSTQLGCMSKAGSQINVTAMIQLQMTMNKFTQIADLGSTCVSLFNNAFRSMISNIKQ
jgi:hypothetical protein